MKLTLWPRLLGFSFRQSTGTVFTHGRMTAETNFYGMPVTYHIVSGYTCIILSFTITVRSRYYPRFTAVKLRLEEVTTVAMVIQLEHLKA